MRSFAIVARDGAGRGKSARTAAAIHTLLGERGVQSWLYIASGERSVDAQVRIAHRTHGSTGKDPLCIVICGGDGSIQEGVNAILSLPVSEVVVGLAPAGTCNDFAISLGMKPSPREIVNVLLHGEVRAVDLGLAGKKYFCTIATLGFESTLNQILRHYVTRSPRRWMFLGAAVVALMAHSPRQARLTIDGSTFNVVTLNLAAANTPSYGGQIQIAPSANPYDGLFDIIMFQPMSAVRRLFMLPQAIAGRHIHRPGVTCLRASRVTIETDRPREIWADGEPIGNTPIVLDVAANALHVLVPK